MKKILITTIAVVSSSICFAEQVGAVEKSTMFSHLMVTLLGIVAGIFLITVGTYLVWLAKFMKGQVHQKDTATPPRPTVSSKQITKATS